MWLFKICAPKLPPTCPQFRGICSGLGKQIFVVSISGLIKITSDTSIWCEHSFLCPCGYLPCSALPASLTAAACGRSRGERVSTPATLLQTPTFLGMNNTQSRKESEVFVRWAGGQSQVGVMGGKGLRFAQNILKCIGLKYPENPGMSHHWLSHPTVASLGYFLCSSRNCYENKCCPWPGTWLHHVRQWVSVSASLMVLPRE